MNVFEKSYEENPPLILMSKSGVTHVFVGAPLPRGGLTKALCGMRPPLFGGDMVDMIELFPKNMTSSVFGTSEGEAPRLWSKHQGALREVSCAQCLAELQRAVEFAWQKTGLSSYGRGDWIDLDHARVLIAAIPQGHWAGFGDVTEACGASRTSGDTLRYFLAQDTHGASGHVCRVLFDDGSSSAGDCRKQLETEGVAFTGEGSGVADASRKMTPGDLTANHSSTVAAPIRPDRALQRESGFA